MNSYEIFHSRFEGFSTNDTYYTSASTDCSPANQCTNTDTINCKCEYKTNVDNLIALQNELNTVKNSMSAGGRESDTNDQYNKLYMSTINLGIGIVIMSVFMNYVKN
jgi:hypothetical protein